MLVNVKKKNLAGTYNWLYKYFNNKILKDDCGKPIKYDIKRLTTESIGFHNLRRKNVFVPTFLETFEAASTT